MATINITGVLYYLLAIAAWRACFETVQGDAISSTECLWDMKAHGKELMSYFEEVLGDEVVIADKIVSEEIDRVKKQSFVLGCCFSLAILLVALGVGMVVNSGSVATALQVYHVCMVSHGSLVCPNIRWFISDLI